MLRLQDYIQNHFGISVTIEPASNQDISILPLYLKGNFDIYKGRLGDKDIIWAKVREEAEATPERLRNQEVQLERIYNKQVVFIFDRLDSWMRKRLIEKKVPFVQPLKQLYIPQLLMELSDITSRNKNLIEKKEYISYSAQLALLYHLEQHILEGKTFRKIAEMLNYSAMTVTRIARELSDYQWIQISDGKEKHISFAHRGKALWDSILPYLRSPVMEIWYYDDPIFEKAFLESGEVALSHYTMLSGPEKSYHAIGKDAFRSLRKLNQLPPMHNQYGKHMLEVWHYDPMLLVEKGSGITDRLSLYLSLQGQNDERLLYALEELINTIEW